MMPNDGKSCEGNRLFRHDVCLLPCNGDLLLRRVDPREIGQQETAPTVRHAFYDNAVDMRIQFLCRRDRLRRTEHIHAVDETIQFLHGNRLSCAAAETAL